MKRRLAIVTAVLTALAIITPLAGAGEGSGETVDVLVQTDGSTAALSDHIESIGGTVNVEFENVAAVAASVPADGLGAVAAISGVTKIEKDALIELDVDDADKPRTYEADSAGGVEATAIDVGTFDLDAVPEGYANFLYTGAYAVWDEVTAGAGSTVAVVDTGVARNTCVGHAVVGAPGYPDGYNSTGDGVPATSADNHWHGTHVAGMIASSCVLDFSADPTHPIYLAQAPHLGWPADFVPIFGQAPEADIYPVKVFPESGEGVPTSVILDGLDHVISLKKDGLLDVDIVNMSLGGPTLYDGRDTFDKFVLAMWDTGIMVITSAGNEGPVPNSVGSPATAYNALSVGALDYAPTARTFFEYLGLAVWPGAPDMGYIMRPTTETRVVNFSSRGPLSDGRSGPDISALGHWTFAEGPVGELRWAGGTSFSSPTVAGAAALLNSWWEGQGHETSPWRFRNVLLEGADANELGAAWQDEDVMGKGALDAYASLDLLMDGKVWSNPFGRSGRLRTTILPYRSRNRTHTYESSTITLDASETQDYVFRIDDYTSKVTVEVFDIETPDNSGYAYWPNALQIDLQSAKRSAFTPPVQVLWYPQFYGDTATIVVEDGPWTVDGGPWAYQPMEPGLMRLTLSGDYSNESPVTFKVKVTREGYRKPLRHPVHREWIRNGDNVTIPVEIPAGVTTATFDLQWRRDWSRFPSGDLDMLVFDPNGALVSIDGATGNAPERAIIDDPEPGTWYVMVDAYEMYRPDRFWLYLTTD